MGRDISGLERNAQQLARVEGVVMVRVDRQDQPVRVDDAVAHSSYLIKAVGPTLNYSSCGERRFTKDPPLAQSDRMDEQKSFSSRWALLFAMLSMAVGTGSI